MDFPTLKLPPEGFTASDSFQAQLVEGTFTHAFYAAIEGLEEASSAKLEYHDFDSEKTLKKNICFTINQYYKEFRQKLDGRMQDYILQHDGTIDSWPRTMSESVQYFSTYKKAKLVFDYFGEDYTLGPDGTVRRESAQKVYRNEYKFPGTAAYNGLVHKKEKLERAIAQSKTGTSLFVRVVSFLGFLYCAFAALSILGELFFGIGDALVALDQPGDGTGALAGLKAAAGLLLALPMHLYSFIGGIFGEVSGALGVFSTIVLIGACLLGGFICLYTFTRYRKAAKKLRQYKKERSNLLKSREYLQAQEENETLRKLNEELAEQWHRAWYEWVVRQFGAPGGRAG